MFSSSVDSISLVKSHLDQNDVNNFGTRFSPNDLLIEIQYVELINPQIDIMKLIDCCDFSLGLCLFKP